MTRSLRLLLGVVCLIGCDGSHATPVSVDPTDPRWTASTAAYSQIRLDLVERADDHALFGQWAGDRRNCSGACRDTGIVYSGQRTGTSMSFGLTALNGTRSLTVAGTMTDKAITGTAKLTDDGQTAAAEQITFRRP